MSQLKQSTKKALFWSALDKGGQQALQLAVGIVTMRLLNPGHFGLVGLLALYTAIANMLSEGGFSSALIRKTNATNEDYSTMFWFNFGLGLVFYIVLYLAAPWIADYNHRPELVLIARVQFLTVLFYALGLIQSTLLIKRSDFKRLGIANVGSVLVSGVAAVVLAVSGYGPWAIVMQLLTQAFVRCLLLWVLSGWFPRLVYRWRSLRELLGFSSKLLLGNLANTISNNFYASALGRYVPIEQVGFYERANKTKESGVGFLTHTFGNSIYLMLCQLQDDAERFLQAFRKSMRTVSFLLFPALLGLAAVANPMVSLIIGDSWLPMVPYLRILCFSGILTVLNYMYGNSLKVKGRSDITLVLDILNAVLLVSFLYLTIGYGLQVAVMADVVAKGIVFITYGTISARLTGYRWSSQLKDLLPYAGLALFMAAGVWMFQYVIEINWLLLVTQIAVGSLFYLSVNKLLGSKVLEDLLETLRWK